MTNLKTRFFELKYEKGAIRWIKNNGIEMVRMIYSAVRDHNWGTIEPEIMEEQITENESGFQVKTRVRYQKADIQFESDYTITGNENRLEFEMYGEAKSTFKTNRIGFCVLHPIQECFGKVCTVIHPDGTSEKAVFPVQISPDQPMKNFSSLEWEPAENIRVKIEFSGDIFEMEDQRNWTDASYKTYCRPLNLPFPFEIKKGEKIQQKIVLKLKCEPQNESIKDFVSLKIDKTLKFKIPEIGVCIASRPEMLTQNEAKILNHFSFDHLRAEINLIKTEWKTELEKCITESNLLKLPFFLVICFSDNFFDELENLKTSVKSFPVNVKYILIVGKNHLHEDVLFEKVYAEMKAIFPETKIGAGVNAYFAEFNRNRPNAENAEFVSFAVCPQVHAFDNNTLVENLEAQKNAVESAKKLFPGKPVFVSPVTLKQRFNVVATSEETWLQPGELPPQVDVRQSSVFAAQWLLGSLKFLAQSGTNLVTYFETVGWRGIIQGDFNPPLPDKFSAKKGDIFPVFQLLREFSGFQQVVFSESLSPLEVDGIVLKRKELSGKALYKILLVNFSSEPKKVKFSGFDDFQSGKTLFSGVLLKQEKGVFEIPPNEVVVISS